MVGKRVAGRRKSRTVPVRFTASKHTRTLIGRAGGHEHQLVRRWRAARDTGSDIGTRIKAVFRLALYRVAAIYPGDPQRFAIDSPVRPEDGALV